MNGVEKAVYAAAISYGFVVGFFIPWFIPSEGHPLFQAARVFLGDSPFVIVIPAILAVGASVTMYVGVRSVARHQPMICLLLMKLAALGLPAIAAGLIASMAFGWLGFYETPRDFFAFCAVAATVYFCAGVTGIVAMNSTPRYKQVLRARNKDRAIAAGRPLDEPDNGPMPPLAFSDWLTRPWGRHKLTWKHFLILWFVACVAGTAISLSMGATPAKSYDAFRRAFVELTKAVRNPNHLPLPDP